MTGMSVLPLSALVLAPLTLAGVERPVSVPAGVRSEPVGVAALTPEGRERAAEVAALMTGRYAPDAAHGTDDNAVRRALQVTAPSRRWGR